jgi:uncharacterized protein YukE
LSPNKIHLDPETYYAAANVCFRAASGLCEAVRSAGSVLDECGSMAGAYSEGVTWAERYDEHVNDFYLGANDLVEALENYGDVLTQAGYNYAVAEGSQPIKWPADHARATELHRDDCSHTSAGGRGNRRRVARRRSRAGQ